MESKYLVIKNGISKKTGKPYSIGCRIFDGGKEKSSFLFEKDTYFTEDIRPIGTVLSVSRVEV